MNGIPTRPASTPSRSLPVVALLLFVLGAGLLSACTAGTPRPQGAAPTPTAAPLPTTARAAPTLAPAVRATASQQRSSPPPQPSEPPAAPTAVAASPRSLAATQPAPTQPVPSGTPIRATVVPAPSATAPAPPAPPAPATNVPATPLPAVAYGLTAVGTGFQRPLYLTAAPGDASGRLFVVEQAGTIAILRGGQREGPAFLDIRGKVGSRRNEQGLLSMAFDPGYTTSGLFYVSYTDLQEDTVVARYRVSAENPNQADSTSEEIVLQVDQPYANHNGGLVLFGPDGLLYIGLGDGGSGGDPQGHGQNADTLLGTILRLDVRGAAPYTIPADNPFVGQAGKRAEIWAFGLRNPWRFSLDRATGDLYIADVGQSAWEEINFQPAASRGGENYGWNSFEGAHPFRGRSEAGLVFPISEYGRGEGCSVTGGYVYRGQQLPGLDGRYLFADFCSGIIWTLTRQADGTWDRTTLLDSDAAITSFGEDEDGEVYVIARQGTIYRISVSGQ